MNPIRINWKEIRWGTLLKEYAVMILGLTVYVFAWTGFLIPHQIAAGGVSGLSSVVYYATGIPLSYTYFVVNVALLVIGTLVLGKGFGFKTIFCIVVSSLFFEFFPLIPWVSDIPDKLLNAMIGGAMCGLGLAMVFLQGGSTGGVDILVLMITKYKKLPTGKLFLFFDVFIITSYILLPDKSFQDVIYGYLVMVALSYTLDLVLTGEKQSMEVVIFSEQYARIADRVFSDIDHGATWFKGVGWYSKREKNLLIIVIPKKKVAVLKNIVKEIDPGAFLYSTPVASVHGEGFERLVERGGSGKSK